MRMRQSFAFALAAVSLGTLTHTGFAAPAATPQTPQVGSSDTATADPPVSRPHTTPCVVQLFNDDTFADYSAKPFTYTPPAACPGPWAKVVFQADFSVTPGRQFDRTANVWVGGANVYFGTTPEPSSKLGPTWHVERDLTDYTALLAKAQAGEVDLGNTVDATYTGIIHGSASIAFYPPERHEQAARTADLVLPLSNGPTGGTVGLATTTSTLGATFTLPTNVERAYLDVFAQSQNADEFWYTCVPDDAAATVQSCGGTGFREAEVSIDGQPAGVSPVFPWIYTGGIDPYLWRPIPGVQTLSFTPYRVDLSPFAGVLSDGQPHTVAVSVFNSDNYFSATATLLVFQDHGRAKVTGKVLSNSLAASPVPSVKEALTTAADGSVSGTVTVTASRRYAITGVVQTSHGEVRSEVSGAIDFSNAQTFGISASAYAQKIDQDTTVWAQSSTSSRSGREVALTTFHWPLSVDIDYVAATDGSSTQKTTIRQEYAASDLTTVDDLPVHYRALSNVVAPTDTLAFDASGNFLGPQGQASSQEYFSFDSSGGCYRRSITAAGGAVTAVTGGASCLP
ncbi:MAG TPA: peptide-N4-asparagine amidase [Polyangiaceae bacterium]|jgi:hypothetical protein